MSLSERLKSARESLGMNQKEIAKSIGVAYTSWLGYEDGANVPGGKVLESLARHGIDLNWLLLGEGAMKREDAQEWPAEGYVQVPRYEVQASAGAGATVYSEQIVDVMSFKADWLKVSLGLSPANAAVISVCGDSMEPFLNDGDLILIDTGVSRVISNSVYVIQYGGSLLVKRIQLKEDDSVIVKSDNPHYEPETFRGESAERLRVIGRLVRRLVR